MVEVKKPRKKYPRKPRAKVPRGTPEPVVCRVPRGQLVDEPLEEASARSGPVVRGRKTLYGTPLSAPEIAYRLGSLGLTMSQAAKVFGIKHNTFSNWVATYEEFGAEWRRGVDEAGCELVEKSLLRRATGYSIVERVYELPPWAAPGDQALVLAKESHKALPPDPTACIFWLCNRSRERWKHVNDWRKEYTGDGELPPPEKFLAEYLAALRRVSAADPAVTKESQDKIPQVSRAKAVDALKGEVDALLAPPPFMSAGGAKGGLND